MDTNVAVVANGKAQQADQHCILKCIDRLRHIRDECLLLDNRNLILKEYRETLASLDSQGSVTPSSSGCGETMQTRSIAERLQ